MAEYTLSVHPLSGSPEGVRELIGKVVQSSALAFR